MKRPIFVANQLYHVYNRGVDKRDIFMEDQDYLRFIHDLWEFNDTNPAEHSYNRSRMPSPEVGLREMAWVVPRPPRQLLVKIHVFCLMKNHYHLLVEPLSDPAMTEFMRKLGTGYTNYFNQKYKRDGSLFQGIFKAILIEKQTHFVHLPYYIHCNPLDYEFHSWRERKIQAPDKALKFLENYRWSSFPDYIGKENFPSVTQRDFFNEFIGKSNWKQEMKNWLDNLGPATVRDQSLE
jgi:putative transposase